MGLRPSWQPAKRGSAFSEADNRGRVARRSRRRFDRALTQKGPVVGLALSGFRKEPVARQGAGKPMGRPRGGSSQGHRHVACAFRSARRAMLEFHPPGNPAETPSVAGGRSGRRKSVTRTWSGPRWSLFRKGRWTPVGWVRSFPPHIPPTGLDRTSPATRHFGAVSSFAGRSGHRRTTALQVAEAFAAMAGARRV
jgi:hypothetical protein